MVGSASGSGRASPTAVIAFCPSCQCTASPVRSVISSSALVPGTAGCTAALEVDACILVRGHSLGRAAVIAGPTH